jgi:hypothetical protein
MSVLHITKKADIGQHHMLALRTGQGDVRGAVSEYIRVRAAGLQNAVDNMLMDDKTATLLTHMRRDVLDIAQELQEIFNQIK